MRKICRKMVLTSVKKFSGNPAALPTQLRPDSFDCGSLRAVGPTGDGMLLLFSSVTLPEAYVAAESFRGCVGNTCISDSFVCIQRRTSPIY